jgi:pyruvate dehydrogenase E2 component (dihydrolipoamide acetyltransferase)/2-oxoglutarate dehydrogenase E2 component (dihydrolipoamide succinyltransferase)
MAEPVVMPKLAMAMQEGSVIEWLAAEGEWVEKGQMVMVVETEKVTYECEAPAAGYVHRLVALNEPVPVFESVALLAGTAQELAALQAGLEPSGAGPRPDAPVSAEPEPQAGTARIVASPVAKKLAAEHGLDLSNVPGSGPRGRIVKADVEQILAARQEAGRAPKPRPARPTLTPLPPQPVAGEEKRILATVPLTGMRKSIAEHMHRSLAESAQMSFMGEIEASELVRLRKTLLRKEEEIGLRISYTDLLVLIVARAVKAAPAVNASLVGHEIRIWADINVGVAVAMDRGPYDSGLIVPVIRGADRLTLTELARARQDLVTRAQADRLTPEDVSGGTITLSNIGMLYQGWMVTTPILNHPETLIVQPGAIVDRPVAVDGAVVVRPVMNLSLTFDHRVVDGLPVARFYNRLSELIQNPAYLHL